MLLPSSLNCPPRRVALRVLVLVLVSAASPPAALAQLSDVKGSKDHPMVSRYAGSVIIGYDFRKFDEFVIPLGVVPAGIGRQTGQVSEYALSEPINQRYLAAKRARPEGDVYVSVYVAANRATHHKETHDRSVILLDVVDAVPIETRMVTVDAAAMAKDIASSGHVALYGIHFDTDKADLKPESQAALQEITSLLKKDPSLKLLIVGHTDNVGAFDYNVGLSERRAAAVVKELTAKHGIAAARLKPAGVGMLSPVAPNDREQGRAKNRRVELVKQ